MPTRKKYKVLLERKDGSGCTTIYIYARNEKALINELTRRNQAQYVMTYDCVSE